jgi:hypothetical protein
MEIIRWNGRPIDRPGIYQFVPIDVYHSGRLCTGPSVSSSGLRQIFNESPADYWCHSALNPNRVEPPESEAFVFGRAVHHTLLGEPAFKEHFVIRPTEAPDGSSWNSNKKICRAWLEEQEKLGRTVLTDKQIEAIMGMAIRLGREPLVAAGALNGVVECSFVWRDAETDVWLLARPDNVAVDSADFIDIKTCTSVHYRDLVKAMDDYSYAQQGALVGEGYRILTGNEMTSFSNYYIKKTPPFSPKLRQIKSNELKRGALMNRSAIRTFAKCFNAKHWPDPDGDQVDGEYIELSERAHERIDAKLRAEGLLGPNEAIL